MHILPESEKHRVVPFFPPTQAGKTLLFAYLQDRVPGITYVDSLNSPRVCLVVAAFHHIAFVGWRRPDFDLRAFLSEILRQEKYLDVVWDGSCPQPKPEALVQYSFARLEFLHLDGDVFAKAFEASQATSGQVSVVDEVLFEKCESKDENLMAYGGKERFLRHCHALVLTQDETYLSDASAILPYTEPDGIQFADLQVITAEAQRRRGYAQKVACALIHDLQKKGVRSIWSCQKGNGPSWGLAKRLGFYGEREFEILALDIRQ